MNRIRLLSEQVANQIAAGEVVERPASVVKELVENSLDAEASRISVEVQAGGRALIRVVDDGLGMSRDDALLCLERHATSKIRKAEDLSAIATMGFRGEALPSIASVSRFTLTTRERNPDSPEGTQIIVAGGKIVEVKAAGTAPGTSIEVRQLFFNLPARRKFLRTEETEAAHIQHYLVLAALAHPNVAMNFQKDGRQVWQLPQVKSGPGIEERLQALGERIRGLYGSEQQLLGVNFEGSFGSGGSEMQEDDEASRYGTQLRVWGYIGAPGVSRATREDQHVFVNRRPVDNRGINYALLEGYHTALMKGRYPVACLFLETDPAAVDVNIHPAKREVKFHREFEVRRLVAQAVRETLLAWGAKASSMVGGPPVSVERPPVEPRRQEQPAAPQQRTLPGVPASLQRPVTSPSPVQRPLPMGFSPPVPRQDERSMAPTSPIVAIPPTAPPGSELQSIPAAGQPSPKPLEPVGLLAVPLRLIGVVGKLYVLLESDRGLVLLDQHAAHERILYEQMLERLQSREQGPCQRLLLPETIELSARDAAFLKQQLPTLSRMGVGVSEFGERTFLLDALPPFVKTKTPVAYVVELIDELKAAGQEVNSLRLGEHVIAKTVCRHAVKANDPLAGAELEKLVEDLKRCQMPYTCPHGRPTVVEMNYRDLEKKFGRTA